MGIIISSSTSLPTLLSHLTSFWLPTFGVAPSCHPHFWKPIASSDSTSYSLMTPPGHPHPFGIDLLPMFWLPTVYSGAVMPSSFWNGIAPGDLTSYGLSCAIMLSSFLELDCFQWFDFPQFGWHCHTFLFWNGIATGDWRPTFEWPLDTILNFWNGIASTVFYFLRFEWHRHAILISW